ncbi:hypothetical protein P389DRAFT_6555 [Cystobasidium minutum MCA 4210]|uniref:uncharacterized protein n=1 Tax=Cystobasidium minutum MCA 4210 TaxID=1397322 RepID=UPI0034CE3BF8|eukprot:jgi/Rhomi1/6555/CE6554_699
MDINTYRTPDQVYDLEKVYVLVTAIPYFILIWDWLANISKEYIFFFKTSSNGNGGLSGGGIGSGTSGRIFSIKYTFIASRYITLAWCTFVVAVLGLVRSQPNLCSWAKYFPYGYSTTMLSAHLVMVLRMYSIYERSKKILIFLLVLAGIDYALQMSANHAATAIYAATETPNLAVCFIVPTSLLYALVFISPTIFHHIVLAMTLYKSIQHIQATRAGGVRSIMNIVQRDQIFFVLAICLINFSNLVLVLQRSSWPYRLINQLPAAAFTQIFLSRIIFSLKHLQKKLASASVSPVITTLALSPSSRRGDFMFGTGSVNDLELGEDIKSSSSPPISSLNHTTPEQKRSRDRFEAATTSKAKKNVFTLKFDPTARRSAGLASAPSYRTHYSAPSSPSVGVLNRDAFQVKEATFESHALSSYRLPSPTSPDTEPSDPPYFSTPSKITHGPSLQFGDGSVDPIDEKEQYSPGSMPPEAQAGPSTPRSPAPAYGHQRQSSSRRLELSPYFEMIQKGEDLGTETPAIEPAQKESIIESVREEKMKSEEPVSASASKSQDAAPRTSLETLNRRASTIDDQQRFMDWEPPSAWGTSASPRASPIPFTERRLSNSVARSSLSLQRSRHASFGTAGRGNRPSLDGSPTGVGRIQNQHRGSACYASIFSFDNNEEALENVEDEEIKSVPSSDAAK